MATGGPPENKDDVKARDIRHTCSLCMEPYHGRSPKLLPCFHTFCLPCLKALEASAIAAMQKTGPSADDEAQSDGEKHEDDEKQEEEKGKETDLKPDDDVSNVSDVSVSQGDVQEATFQCPTCRTPVVIPKGGVASFQTNFYVDHEASGDEGKAAAPILCGTCKEGEQQTASHHCRECQMAICRTCRHYHDKFMPKHHVTAVGLGQPLKESAQKRVFCLVHQDQALCFHCHQCDVSICLHCKLTSHEGHQTVDLAIALLKAKEEITSLVPVAQQQVQVLESAVQQVAHEDRQLTLYAQQMTQHVNARYDVLMTWARQSRDQLVEDISGKEASDRSQLGAEKSSMTLTRDTLSALLSDAARATATDPHVLVLRSELKAALLTDVKLDQHKKRVDTQRQAWGWSYDITDASVLQMEDVEAYMGRVTQGACVDTTIQPVSLRQLADRMERWMKEVEQEQADSEKKMKSLSKDLQTSKKNEADLQKKTEAASTDLVNVQMKMAELHDAQRKTAAELQISTLSVNDKIGKLSQSVAFYVSFALTREPSDGRLIFSSMQSNSGNCYDEATGIFICTISGLYVFSATVGSANEQHFVAANIMLNGNSKIPCIRGSYASMGCASLSLHLDALDTVWLRADCDITHYCKNECSFTGVLVQPQL